MGRLEGKVCIVTGASAGIGRATAELFCREGAKVVAVARREERLKELAEECKDAPGEITWYAGDVGDPAAAVGMVKKAVETFGRLDVAVNCAGVMDDNTAIADMSDEMLEKTFRINTFGLMYGLREECKQYLAQGDGGVIVPEVFRRFGGDGFGIRYRFIGLIRQNGCGGEQSDKQGQEHRHGMTQCAKNGACCLTTVFGFYLHFCRLHALLT